MKLIIAHYHLQTGGVTRIVQSQIEAVRRLGCAGSSTVLLTGAQPEGLSIDGGTDVRVHPDLDYLPAESGPREWRRRSASLERVLREAVSEDAVLHVHNPNLGKNPVLTYVLWGLASEGLRLVYHCHDFAEDRPVNGAFNRRVIGALAGESYIHTVLYPGSDRCVYGAVSYTHLRAHET